MNTFIDIPKKPSQWKAFLASMHTAAPKTPSVSEITQLVPDHHKGFAVLISTIISLRTRDEVTLPASKRILQEAGSPDEMVKLSSADIEQLIYPAAFFRNKAKNIHSICEILIKKHKGRCPDMLQELLALPGVGLKTANLTLALGFGIPAICVDIHVHRICNRMGIIDTETPDESEKELTKLCPRTQWNNINEYMVPFGQHICTPQSPWCSKCPFDNTCLKIKITRNR